jgi:hypothetical protein
MDIVGPSDTALGTRGHDIGPGKTCLSYHTGYRYLLFAHALFMRPLFTVDLSGSVTVTRRLVTYPI